MKNKMIEFVILVSLFVLKTATFTSLDHVQLNPETSISLISREIVKSKLSGNPGISQEQISWKETLPDIGISISWYYFWLGNRKQYKTFMSLLYGRAFVWILNHRSQGKIRDRQNSLQRSSLKWNIFDGKSIGQSGNSERVRNNRERIFIIEK